MMPQGERTWATANPDQDGEPGFTGLALEALLGKLDGMTLARKGLAEPRIPWEACHPIWFTGSIPLTGGAGTLLQSNLYGPELPYWWDVRSVALWGWTVGTVTIYRNSTSGEQFGAATTPGEFTWGAQKLIGPQDSLVFGATGITGSVFVAGQAIEVESQWLPEYLM